MWTTLDDELTASTDRPRQVVHRQLEGRADVEDVADRIGMVEQGHQRPHGVEDVAEAPALLAGPVDR